MSIADGMVQEFTHEAQNTRSYLERLPEDKLGWKPHDKSMTLGRLASHLAEIPEWTQVILKDEVFDMDAVDYEARDLQSKQEILDLFDKNVAAFGEAMKGETDEELFKHWQMKMGGKITMDLARVVCLRSFILSHTIHHRGQLSVYLRENDVPLPGIYGPSADEGM